MQLFGTVFILYVLKLHRVKFTTPQFTMVKVKAKSVYEPSGPLDRSLPRFSQREATRSISIPPWIGCQSIAGLPPALSSPAGTHLYIWVARERHCESKLSCPRTYIPLPG